MAGSSKGQKALSGAATGAAAGAAAGPWGAVIGGAVGGLAGLMSPDQEEKKAPPQPIEVGTAEAMKRRLAEIK